MEPRPLVLLKKKKTSKHKITFCWMFLRSNKDLKFCHFKMNKAKFSFDWPIRFQNVVVFDSKKFPRRQQNAILLNCRSQGSFIVLAKKLHKKMLKSNQ